ncbi:hypothetical protein CEXT_134741 [Caerostris extrusa]|uniref:Uncharacterized protein n=1 Tax=Caerostris extrusa TaxID=172846 RepID=A0AAV4WDV6_CAEEX|nr:hypothetical protein CEXT_134741 [Caerostris extrusa]
MSSALKGIRFERSAVDPACNSNPECPVRREKNNTPPTFASTCVNSSKGGDSKTVFLLFSPKKEITKLAINFLNCKPKRQIPLIRWKMKCPDEWESNLLFPSSPLLFFYSQKKWRLQIPYREQTVSILRRGVCTCETGSSTSAAADRGGAICDPKNLRLL